MGHYLFPFSFPNACTRGIAPPQISEAFFSQGLEVVAGEIAQLECTAFGVPAPNISWEAEDTVLINGGRINITVMRNSTGNSVSSTLAISDVTLSDDGLFACVADNGVLPTAISALNLTVLCKSTMSTIMYVLLHHFFWMLSAVPPTLSTPFEDLEVLIDNDITLSCSSNGFHLPVITWTPPDPTNDRLTISSSATNESFIVSHLNISTTEQTDTGYYGCNAENSVGSDSANIFLQVLGIAIHKALGTTVDGICIDTV